MSECEVEMKLKKAFRLWAEHANVVFKQVQKKPYHVHIRFASTSNSFIL